MRESRKSVAQLAKVCREVQIGGTIDYGLKNKMAIKLSKTKCWRN